jgi:hypothetical protein
MCSPPHTRQSLTDAVLASELTNDEYSAVSRLAVTVYVAQRRIPAGCPALT